MTSRRTHPTGVGLGLRWEFLEEVLESVELPITFFEVSPENYMRRGGYYPASLQRIRERYPIVTHGLTLSIGGVEPPDAAYLRELRGELAQIGTPWHSDHLCFATAAGRALHDLFPLPFSEESLCRVAARARHVEAALGLPLALENISYYAAPARPGMSEAEFVARAVETADVGLLLDVNNVFVNAQNHGQDPLAFLRQMPLERVLEIHVAGHRQEPSGLLLDTHGSPVTAAVYELLEWVIERTGPVPVLLERDNAVPSLAELLLEAAELDAVYQRGLMHFQERARRAASERERTPELAARREPAPPSAAMSAVDADSVEQQGLEAAVAELVFAAPSPGVPALFAAGAFERERLLVYRQLIRSTLRDALELAIPRTMARLGPAFDRYFTGFLAERAFNSHYLRDVTAEFIAYLAASNTEVPAHLLELARLEALHLEIAAMPVAPAAPPAVELELDAGLRFIEAARLVQFTHAVHELSEDLADRAEPALRTTRLLVYRSPDHNVRYLQLSELAARLLERLLAGESLRTSLTQATESAGHALDDRVLEGTAQLLSDLGERGVLLGARPARAAASSLVAEQSTLPAKNPLMSTSRRLTNHD